MIRGEAQPIEQNSLQAWKGIISSKMQVARCTRLKGRRKGEKRWVNSSKAKSRNRLFLSTHQPRFQRRPELKVYSNPSPGHFACRRNTRKRTFIHPSGKPPWHFLRTTTSAGIRVRMANPAITCVTHRLLASISCFHLPINRENWRTY